MKDGIAGLCLIAALITYGIGMLLMPEGTFRRIDDGLHSIQSIMGFIYMLFMAFPLGILMSYFISVKDKDIEKTTLAFYYYPTLLFLWIAKSNKEYLLSATALVIVMAIFTYLLRMSNKKEHQ